MVIHIDVLIQMGTIQNGCKVEFLGAVDHFQESGVCSVVVVPYSQRMMAQWDLVVQGPILSVLHMDVSQKQVGLVDFLPDELNSWSVDLPVVSSER